MGMEDALHSLRTDIVTCELLENNLRGKPAAAVSKPRSNSKASRKEGCKEGMGVGAHGCNENGGPRPTQQRQDGCGAVQPRSVNEILWKCILACRESRKRHREENAQPDNLDDASLSQLTRFTDQIAMDPYKQFLHYVPRLVNVVTLAEALPMPGSGVTLPLNLSAIASCCKGSFYAPRRFAAVQLAYSDPRCRVLVFHTGRLVGTGTAGPAAARLAIARAQRQLADEANVHLNIRNFAVINSVGAVSLRATLNCDAFATEHSGESHFDRSSFVGLAWRPPRESICCEIYSTGKANLPGSVVERQLLESFSRMLPELLRFSSANQLLELIPDEVQAHHRVFHVARDASASSGQQPAERKYVVANKARQRLMGAVKTTQKVAGLWDGWEDAGPADAARPGGGSDSEANDEGIDWDALGL